MMVKLEFVKLLEGATLIEGSQLGLNNKLTTVNEIAESKLDIALSWLFIGAIFFAMRSCEYLKTTANEGSKRTKIL